tara:strand:+ start:164 stop:763 length:600 start_codon:yes stop_codon:yes gene_type:complete
MSDATYDYDVDGRNVEMTKEEYLRNVSGGAITPDEMQTVMDSEAAMMPRERQGPDELDKQIAQFQEIIAAINAGTYPGDVAEVQQIFDNLPPEMQSRVLGTVDPDLESASGAPVQPEYFGALPGDPGMGQSAAQASGAPAGGPMPGAGGPMMEGATGLTPRAAGPMAGAAAPEDMAAMRASKEDPGFQRYLENLRKEGI